MLESFCSCTKRRMIISIIALGVLTIVILILEEKLTTDSHWNQSPTPIPQSNESATLKGELPEDLSALIVDKKQVKSADECWTKEEYKIVVECAPCKNFETNSGSIPACKPTGLKETVHCNISGTVFRSCSSKVAETARFWVFESLMLLMAVVSFGYCRYRTSQIERANNNKSVKQIERRLASGM